MTAQALEAGYRHIDTATAYHNESGIGKALASSTLARESIFVTTKLPPDHAGRERRTLEESLSKLGVDYVDLWLVHWPPNGRAAPRVWEQLVKARQDGLAKAIGVSNYSLGQIDELAEATGATPEVNQIRWGPSIYDPGCGLRAAATGSRAGGIQPVQGEQPERSDAGLDRLRARRNNRASDRRLAHGARFRGDPQVGTRANVSWPTQPVRRIELTAEEVAAIDGLSSSGQGRIVAQVWSGSQR